MKTMLAILAVLLLAGCSTSGGLSAQIAGANIEIARERAQAAAKPVLNASIPIPGCKAPEGLFFSDACVMTIIVHAPNTAPTTIPMPSDDWARVADRAVGVLGTAAGIYLGGDAAVGLVRGVSGGIADALRTQPAPVIVPPADPVVVTQPDPVVVTQPPPVIVEPVVVDPVVVSQPATQFGP